MDVNGHGRKLAGRAANPHTSGPQTLAIARPSSPAALASLGPGSTALPPKRL